MTKAFLFYGTVRFLRPVHMSPAIWDTHLSEIHCFIWKTISNSYGKWVSPVRWDLSEMGWKCPRYERKFGELARLTGTNVLRGAFWFAEMHSFQYFRALSQGSETNFFPYETTLIFISLRWVFPDSRAGPGSCEQALTKFQEHVYFNIAWGIAWVLFFFSGKYHFRIQCTPTDGHITVNCSFASKVVHS